MEGNIIPRSLTKYFLKPFVAPYLVLLGDEPLRCVTTSSMTDAKPTMAAPALMNSAALSISFRVCRGPSGTQLVPSSWTI